MDTQYAHVEIHNKKRIDPLELLSEKGDTWSLFKGLLE
jgi:hypothetical protein